MIKNLFDPLEVSQDMLDKVNDKLLIKRLKEIIRAIEKLSIKKAPVVEKKVNSSNPGPSTSSSASSKASNPKKDMSNFLRNLQRFGKPFVYSVDSSHGQDPIYSTTWEEFSRQCNSDSLSSEVCQNMMKAVEVAYELFSNNPSMESSQVSSRHR